MVTFEAQCARLRYSLSTLRPAGRPDQDARLASGCWPDSAGRDWLPAGFHERFPRCFLHLYPPFPGFAWRKSHFTSKRYSAESNGSPATASIGKGCAAHARLRTRGRLWVLRG